MHKPERDKFLAEDEFRRLLAVARSTGQAALRERNYMLFCLAGNLGLRISEACDLRLGDFNLDGRSSFVRVRTRKRGIVSDLPLEARLVTVVKPYLLGLGKRALLRREGGDVAALETARMRVCLFPGDKGPGTPMSVRTASKLFKQVAKLAGLRPAVSFHSLRHYRGIQLYKATRDLNAVKRLLRHSSIFSVAHYQHLVEDECDIVRKVGSVI